MNDHLIVRRGSWRAALPLATLLLLATCRANEETPRLLQPQDAEASSQYWVDQYPAVPETDPHVRRARKVFERMEAAAGHRARLLILEGPKIPSALALADDTVLLDREGLALCYRDVPPAKGDARLAFVLAHELKHLAGGDLWHASAFLTVRNFAHGPGEDQRLLDLLHQNPHDRQQLELRADEAGVLALITAGYDPRQLFQGSETFFETWVKSPAGLVVYQDPNHPAPAERARFLRRRLQEVAGKIDLFHRGVEAYEATEYPKAIELLEEFRQHFAGREVLNDLALSHYQLAAAVLAECDGTLVDRYRLPVELDTETLADRAKLRGAGESSPCFENPGYHAHMTEALALLRQAADQDSAYLPARLNLAAALALDQQGAGALEAADQAAKLAPDDPRALVAVQVAGLVYADAGGTLVDPARAVAALAALHRRFPADPAIAYDLASALSHHRRLAEARPVWAEFLRLEPEGPWAVIAREWVGDDQTAGVAPAASGRVSGS